VSTVNAAIARQRGEPLGAPLRLCDFLPNILVSLLVGRPNPTLPPGVEVSENGLITFGGAAPLAFARPASLSTATCLCPRMARRVSCSERHEGPASGVARKPQRPAPWPAKPLGRGSFSLFLPERRERAGIARSLLHLP
jgi:hypothetical protein